MSDKSFFDRPLPAGTRRGAGRAPRKVVPAPGWLLGNDAEEAAVRPAVESGFAVDVDVPVEQAFEKWRHYERLPEFLVGVNSSEVVGEHRLRWVGEDETGRNEWYVVVSDVPNRRFAWKASGDVENHGVISFIPLAGNRTRLEGTLLSDDGRIQLDVGKLKAITERPDGRAGD